MQLAAVPNPATVKVTLRVTGTIPAGTQVELVEVATGRPIRTSALAGSEWRSSVAELAAGVSVARLLHQQQLLGVMKVVVLH
ncbi:hypothetical protein Q5H93_19235 [Hymenobacter sp. ASUV-10]|uniref:Uncharacterized protein n=1 Tax=Hymenobacter aranciens TaxID=3063996 RepID=A0ABT9BF34_9BACT|nr:hypothetical protein [Hymenobacter sp. ASUV-10]MDO7876888.1 hypothetical protein [Hymenobacter sp. ASUV-10]